MISDIEEETQDIDWFAVDANGEIGHFASGGRGFLPPSVKISRENQLFLTSFFQRKLVKNGDVVESLNPAFHIGSESGTQKANLADFVKMGAKGLYSFDCTVGRKRPTGYFLVAKPSHPLSLRELPKDIAEVLRKTRFPGSFSMVDAVQENEFD